MAGADISSGEKMEVMGDSVNEKEDTWADG